MRLLKFDTFDIGRSLERLLLIGVFPGLALTGCDSLLDVTDPENATIETLSDPAALPTLIAGAIRDFNIGYSGPAPNNTDAMLTSSAVLSDELISSGTFTTRQAVDQRRQFPIGLGNAGDEGYAFLHNGRVSSKRAAAAILEVTGDPSDPDLVLMRNLEGFSIVALAEAYCQHLAFSEIVDGEFNPGQPVGAEAALGLAIQAFDQALAAGPGDNLALVGKGRALVNLGRYSEAAAAVSSVPTSFVYFVEHSTNTAEQQNNIQGLQDNGRYSMGDNEGLNGLDYLSAQDPRVPWIQDPAGVGFDLVTPLFISQRHFFQDSDMPLADGIEARLIEAEAALNAGDVSTWLSKLNELRADVRNLMSARWQGYTDFVPGPNNPTTTLNPLTDPGDDASRIDLLFEERAFWLYMTGHRLGDMRRLVRNYGRATESVFPTGVWHKGSTYGSDVVLPISQPEQNNPNVEIGQCSFTDA
jgi:hypothetical protein